MRKLISFILLLWLYSYSGMAQQDMFKALFMYNFTKDIEWPTSYKTGDFVITILGNSPIMSELEKIASIKKVGTQPIKLEKVNNVDEISKSHMLYIPPSKSSSLQPVLSKLNDKPVVIITDRPGMAREGAGINYVEIDGKQKFEINPSALQKQGLKVNSYLTSLGIVIK